MKRKDAGFSLVEVLVSIVVLALVVIPLCTSLVMAIRMNTKADALLKAQLAVSSTVEELMASGINWDSLKEKEEETTTTTESGANVLTFAKGNVIIAIETVADTSYYIVTVSYDDDLENDGEYLVSVETSIRAATVTPDDTESGEGDGQ